MAGDEESSSNTVSIQEIQEQQRREPPPRDNDNVEHDDLEALEDEAARLQTETARRAPAGTMITIAVILNTAKMMMVWVSSKENADAYFEWETKVEQIFDLYDYPAEKKAKLAAIEFKGNDGVHEQAWDDDGFCPPNISKEP
ncbi:hypothetical protein E2562_036381 [Oryza meyeriana var. granulata]|uniref:Retrotransposon gag domain-containing protein n=1 Tax=Oryza meyeriana var. granulata TaxID=110450 RepID=A0A6G1F1W3_9ORYZ|nr:hypothetical protein E2562_036381 [Oryza meyeriana var. granulata]